MVKSASGTARLRVSICAVLATLSGYSPALGATRPLAQTITGTIVGRIVDVTGSPIEGVLVKIENLDNGFAYASRTTPAGIYRVEFLQPAAYRITAEKDGFQTGVIARFVAEVNRTKEIIPPPITLVRNVSPSPLGSGPAGQARLQVNTSDATHRASADHELIDALPIQGFRSVDVIALLAPGVTPAPETYGTTGPGLGAGVGTPGQFSVNGQRARSNNFTIDGSDNNDQDVGVRRQGFVIATSEPADTVSEFEISTLLSDAEAGRNSGGQVNVVTRDGSNVPHGRLYGLLTDSHLNARDFFDYSGELLGLGANPARNPLTRLQSGALASVPLVRDRAHMFIAFEGLTVNRADEVHFVTPTLREREQALGVDHLSQHTGSLGEDVLCPQFYPAPNDPGGPYGDNTLTEILDGSAHGFAFVSKADGQFGLFGNASVLSGRYAITDDTAKISSVDRAINGSVTARTRTQNVAFALNTLFSDALSNQVRLSYGRTSNNFDESAGSPFVFDSPNGLTGPIGRLLIEPYSPLGVDPFTFPQGRANNTIQIADTAVYVRGALTLKVGADIRRVQLNSFLDRNYRLQMGFAPIFTVPDVCQGQDECDFQAGSTLDALGAGLPSQIQQALAIVADSSLGLRFTESTFFVQASWRPRPTLTVSLGLRYEYNTVPTDSAGRLERNLAIQAGQFPVSRPRSSGANLLRRLLAEQETVLDGRAKIYESDTNDFAPRLGLAWDVRGDGRMSLRVGYGLYYDMILGTAVNQSRNVFPVFLPLGLAPPEVFYPAVLSVNPAFITYDNDQHETQPLLVPGTNIINVPLDRIYETLGKLNFVGAFDLAFTLPEARLRSPYVHQYSIDYELAIADRYVASVSYVGGSGHKLTRFRTPNAGPVTPALYLEKVARPRLKRPDALLGSYTTIEDSANSNYNALQLSLIRRDLDGLGFQLAYTYSHGIDDVSDVNDMAGAFVLAQDETSRDGGLRLERGNASYDVRHRFTAAFTYDLPFWRERAMLGGYGISGIVTLQGGQPFTVNTSIDTNFDGNLTDRLNTDDGLAIQDTGRTRIVLTRPFGEYLAAIGGGSASVGRNTFRAAGIATVDLALTKRFAFTDSQALQVRVEGFNVLNRTHFGIPVRVLESPGFGSSTTTSVPNRMLQFAVTYEF